MTGDFFLTGKKNDETRRLCRLKWPKVDFATFGVCVIFVLPHARPHVIVTRVCYVLPKCSHTFFSGTGQTQTSLGCPTAREFSGLSGHLRYFEHT